MTTLAKIEANRCNGRLSTGPQTAEGKAVVSRNATTHGIFAAVPVIPGEDPAAWESHRVGPSGQHVRGCRVVDLVLGKQ